MNFPKTTAIGISIASALACAALVFAQEIPRQRDLSRPQAVETSRDSRMTGIMAVRLINTAESRYKYRHGTYATWEELLRSGEIDSLEKPATPFQGLHLSAGPEVTSGWMLSLVTAANGQSYELSLRDRKSTRLNSSHPSISYAVFCLKKKTKTNRHNNIQ